MSFELEQTLVSPEQRLNQGNVVLAVEMLDPNIQATAQELVESRQTIIEGIIPNEFQNNAVTGIMEKITAAGHMSVVEFEGDQETVHLQTLKRLLNGYDENSPEWERERRFQEICEELSVYEFFKKVKTGELPDDSALYTNSDFPDEEVDFREKHAVGYRTINSKGMLRSYHFKKQADGSWVRVLEQLSRSNSDDLSTREWYNHSAAAVPLGSTGALGLSFVASRERLPDGLVSLQQELDGADRLYGEPRGEALKTRPDYEDLRWVSADRETKLHVYTAEMYKYDEKLKKQYDRGLIDYDERLSRFYSKIDNDIIPRLLLIFPEFALDTYGGKSVVAIRRASTAFYAGDYEQAQRYLQAGHMKRDVYASAGCGGAGKNKDSVDTPDDMFKSAVDRAQEDLDSMEEEEESGACEYSGTFCFCCPYEDDGTPASKPIEVTVDRDSDKVATCRRCKACMKGDKVVYKGTIWERAQNAGRDDHREAGSALVGFTFGRIESSAA